MKRVTDSPAQLKLATRLIRVATAFAHPPTQSLHRTKYENQNFKQIGKRSIDIKPVLRFDTTRTDMPRNTSSIPSVRGSGSNTAFSTDSIERKALKSTARPVNPRIMGHTRELTTSAYIPVQIASVPITRRDEMPTQSPSPLDVGFDEAAHLDIEVDGMGEGMIPSYVLTRDHNSIYKMGDLMIGCWTETRR